MNTTHKGWYSRNYLPHFDAPHLMQSITFRLYDALPWEILSQLQCDLESGRITDTQRLQTIETYMDAGHGACWLRRPDIAEIVQDALQYFDGERYRLLAWCVMPNHVHVLIETFASYPMGGVLFSWKSFSAGKANTLLNRQGRFWQREYFDRYIRDAIHYDRVVFYIENNPVKAGFVARAGDWRFGSAARREASAESADKERRHLADINKRHLEGGAPTAFLENATWKVACKAQSGTRR